MTMHTTGLTQEQINTLMKGIPTYYNIDINTFEGMIDGDLVVYEKGGNPNDGFVDLNQSIFRQRGSHQNSTAYARLDMVEDGTKYFVCHTAHTSTSNQVDTTKFNVVFDGAQVLSEIQSFNANTAPRLKRLEDEVLLQLGVV